MKKMTAKNMIGCTLTAMLACTLLLTGCGKTQLPTQTGAELGIYRMGDAFVNADGCEYYLDGQAAYRMDEKGNVVARNDRGQDCIIIAADKVTPFTWAADAAYDAKQAGHAVPCYTLRDGSVMYDEASWDLTLMPTDSCVNNRITVESSDARTLSVNGGSSAEADLKSSPSVKLTANHPGTVKLTVKNLMGQTIKTIDVNLTDCAGTDNGRIAALEQRVAACDHSYGSEVVKATESSQGYTLHLCSKCWHSYKDSFTDKQPCAHEFTASKVTGTCRDKGYTLMTCTKCGATEKKDETNYGGHQYIEKVVAATCATRGYTLHTCSVCGHQEKDSYTALSQHKYVNKVVAPTYKEEGCTKHTCSVCGYSFNDTFTAKLVCKNHDFVQVKRVDAGCTANGVLLKECRNCGYQTADPLYAVGKHDWKVAATHSATCCEDGYEERVCQRCNEKTTEKTQAATGVHDWKVSGHRDADCEEGSYDEMTCTMCGKTTRANASAALGHDWENSTEKVFVGCHDCCSICEMDFDEEDMTEEEIEEHLSIHHAPAFVNSMDIYETHKVRSCRRCDALEKIA